LEFFDGQLQILSGYELSNQRMESMAYSRKYLDDLKKWNRLGEVEWVKLHVSRFSKIRQRYGQYEQFLKDVLKDACRKLAPLAIIEARTKSIPSFAEKILRKKALYTDPRDPLPPDPLVRVTDLCGGRVITQTSSQVESVCNFIKKVFEIDWANSGDVSQRLTPAEFGYRSVHYIVSIDAKKLKAAGIEAAVPEEVLNLKAEIQVRTLLEHAWADIGHDMAYKTEVKVPVNIRRQFAAIAAVLESADREFERVLRELDVFKSNYGAYLEPSKVGDEIQRLQIVLQHDPKNIDLAVKIAHLALSIGRHDQALETVAPYSQEPHKGVQRVQGVALTDLSWDKPKDPQFIRGRDLLEAACRHPDKDAETLCAWAESWAREDETKARDIYQQAVAADATEPVALCRYLEFEVAHLTNDTVVRLASPMIRNAMERCRSQIAGRVNLPAAWASLTVFHLFAKEPFKALMAMAQLIRLCDNPQAALPPVDSCETGRGPCAAGRALLRMQETFRRIKCIRKEIDGFEWCERLLLLGLAVRVHDDGAIQTLKELSSHRNQQAKHIEKTDSIVILSGGCIPEVQGEIERFRPHLLRACEGLAFTLFCGGTTSGISGLAGEIAKSSNGNITACGYLPQFLPRGVKEDKDPDRFAFCFSSPGCDFTPLDPLQGWTDIIAAGIEPCRIKVLSYCGGEISQTECAVGLALGARVGVVEDPALPKNRRFAETGWDDHKNLIRLPMDAMTLRAFLVIDQLPGKRKEYEMAAKQAHLDYVKFATPKDPAFLPWDDEKHPEDFKLSCYHQVAYAEAILKSVGLGIRKLTNPKKKPFDIEAYLKKKKKSLEELAEMEHGRWNVERLLLGWRFAETKDVAKKQSPYLIPWHALTQDIQKFDFDIIRTLPGKFKAAGLEIYLLAGFSRKALGDR
jgi:ppGpp synthetase/RelA/SpoT-type nucleotidyltranferase